jgi:DnaJ-class molecular chaperone
MKQSETAKNAEHLKQCLDRLRLFGGDSEAAVTCPACGGSGVSGDGTNLVVCPTCNGQKMVVQSFQNFLK